MTMKRISDKDRNLLCASLHINCYKRVVEELVYNSLDAESSSIAIRVCYTNKIIQVLDNGTGIRQNDFKILGERYVTSKLTETHFEKSISESNKYGYRGMSLACIIELSKSVIISSKCTSLQETWLKSFKKGMNDDFRLTTSRPSTGTTVEISDFLYNRVIQQKSIDLSTELNSIKNFLERLSLVHNNVSMSLRDDSRNEIIFQIHKNRDMYKTLWSLFEISRNDMQNLQVEKNQYKVKAYINKNNLKTRKYHWIYVNGKIVYNSIIHTKINEELSKKLLYKPTNKKLKEKNRFNGENYLFNDKIPSYFIFLSCPHLDFDLNYNQESTEIIFRNWDEINRLIEKLITFYCGDVSKLSYHIPKNVKIPKDEQNNDTRKKVKEIMENILNNNEKKNKISHIQNGINGKQIKRLIKKKKDDKTQLKIKENVCKSEKYIDLNKKENNNYHDVSLSKKLINKNIDKPEKKLKKRDFASIVLKRFQNPTESVKRRCQEISNAVRNLQDLDYFKNSEIFNKEKICTIITKNRTNTDYSKESNKCTKQDSKLKSENIYDQGEICLFNNCRVVNVKTSYDLLKTINIRNFPPENETSIKRQTAREYKFSSKCNYTYSTFNSHKRNREYLNQITRKQRSPIVYDFNQKSDKKFSSNSYRNINNEVLETQSNQLKKNDDPKYTEECNFLTSYNSYFGSRNTYTIDILNSFNDTKDVNKTYSVKVTAKYTHSETKSESPTRRDRLEFPVEQIHIDSASYNNLKNNINYRENFTNIVESISESQISQKTLEPLGFCEAILSNRDLGDVEKAFDTSFFDSKNITMNKFNDKNQYNESTDNISQFFNHDKNNVKHYTYTENTSLNIYSEKQLGNTDTELLNISKENICQPQQNVLVIKNNVLGDFKMNTRHSFVPKGMSQIFKNKFTKNIDCRNLDKEYYEDTVYKLFAEDILDKFDVFEPIVKNVNDDVTKELIKVKHKIKKDNSDLIFNSESLQHAQVLGQVDRKFIAVRLMGRFATIGNEAECIALFDQHAVDERISLERNLTDYFDGEKWKSAPLETVAVKLSHEDLFYLNNYRDKFVHFGFEWILSDKELLVNAIPKAIIGNNFRKAEVIFNAIRNFISEQIDVIKSLKGNVCIHPKSIMQLVFSEACRYAIKFGDPLSKDDCKKLIKSLANCKTPFQCAHGRPVMAVIMELHNNIRNYTVNVNRIKEFKHKYFEN